MKCTPLKDFIYSNDGIAELHAVKGERCEIIDGLVPGLEEEGFVSVAKTKRRASTKDAGRPAENKSAK